MLLTEVNPRQTARLLYIEARLLTKYSVTRANLRRDCFIASAAASRSLTWYRKLNPCGLEYNCVRQWWERAEGFRPIFFETNEMAEEYVRSVEFIASNVEKTMGV